ncbi:SDR family NAD(P)-dependent oxidoreductase [Streptomyces hirsutus]|uniref:SDR family NAD(P)-dependent oxidoreductase n=1 Tax=Streptomyces hirsutus TaxID=35620 RepID=UPI0033B357E7
MDRELEDRCALVTGAGSGMGAATALLFAEQGARVLVADIDHELGEATARAIRDRGGDAVFLRTDVSVEEDVERAVATAVERWGRLDCAVNNAAVAPDAARLVDLDVSAFDRIVSVNLRAVALCLKHELRQFVRQGEGPRTIVNIGSVSSVRARVGNTAYVAAKHAVVGLTKVAALEHGAEGIRANAVLPGGVDTPMIRASRAGRTPVDEFSLSVFGRLGTPEEVAQANLWLSSERSSYVTGHCLAVDGGHLVQ